MTVPIVTLAQQPNLVEAMWSVPSTWPAFMFQDPVAAVYYPQLPAAFPDYQLLALDEHGAVVARVNSAPFYWDGSDEELPDRGWDGILERAFSDRGRGREPTAVSLLEARIAPHRQGAGLSTTLLRAARGNVQRLGMRDTVRPGPPDREKRGTLYPDAGVRRPGPRRRAAQRPVAAGPRPARRPAREDLPAV